MEVMISNSPIGKIRGERIVPEWATDEAYDHLIKVRDKREPVTIRTPQRTFDKMVLKHLSIPRTKDTGDAMVFTAVFQAIDFVTNASVKRTAIPARRTADR